MATPHFLDELKRRGVFRVGVAYAVLVWLLIQICAIVFPLLLIPDWLTRAVVVLLLIGFPVALLLAWAYESPHAHVAAAGTDAAVGVAPHTSRRSMIALALVGALLALIAGIAYWHLRRASSSLATQRAAQPPAAAAAGAAEKPVVAAAAAIAPVTPVATDRQSVAVLPLLNISGNSQDNYLGEGISEEVLNALSRLPGIKVIGRESSFRFRGSDIDAAKIGRELGVRNLLSGTVQRTGDDLRITVELDDAQSGLQLWSQRYDRRMKGLFALEDDISGAIAKALAVKLGSAADHPLVDTGTGSAQAHDLYLQAIRLYWHTDEASLEQAVALFNQAIADDPNYAEAWAGLAQAYVYLADVYRAPLDLLPAMKGAAEKAVALAPKLASAHLQLGYVLLNYERDFEAGRRELELAVALNPGSPLAHALLGLYRLRIDKDPARARSELQIARKLDPLNAWYPRWEVFAAVAQGDATAAAQLAARVRQLDPGFSYDGDAEAFVDGAFGHWQACIGRYTIAHVKASRASPQLAICQANAGDAVQARAILDQLETEAKSRYVDRTYIAAIDAALGEKDRAFAALEQALHDRSVHLISLWLSPWFKPLHGDPRFQTLLDRIDGAAGTNSSANKAGAADTGA
jgi:adenylate cyclase